VTFTGFLIQTYTIPTTGDYFLEAIGGQGGGATRNDGYGGFGALVSGTDFLTAGTVLEILSGAAARADAALHSRAPVAEAAAAASFLKPRSARRSQNRRLGR
jgi:hypothetical protein